MTDLIFSEKALSVRRMCQLAGLPRSNYYRSLRRPPVQTREHQELRAEIAQIATDWPCYGYRRIDKELRRRNRRVNHKRVLRLMREDLLLCVPKRKKIFTTDSQHSLPIYPNLIRELVLSGPNQVWLADITYIALVSEVVYLAVLMDAFSRKVIGWALDRHMQADLPLQALEMALRTRAVSPALIHHSDRGSQYASWIYTQKLKDAGIQISMSRTGNPYDNARCERLIKTLKVEEVYLYEYDNFNEARARIAFFIEDVYNKKRLHSKLGYLPPAEFEQVFFQPSSA
jgi:transposase InsO family protein